MGTTYYPFANQTEAVTSTWHYSLGTFSCLCFICGLFTNGLVIYVFAKNPSLRRPRNFFLINLAITDIGLLLTTNTLHIISSFIKHWPFGRIGCVCYGLFGGISGLTSIATMAAISLTRLAVVIKPFSSLQLSGSFALKCIVCSWIYGSVWMIPPLFNWNRFIFEGFGTTCTFDYISKRTSDRLYMLILIIGGFLIPLFIIVISYIIILIKLSKRARQLMYENGNNQNYELQAREQPIYYYQPSSSINDDRSRTGTINEPYENRQITQHLRRTELRVTQTALLVCGVYCLAWGPYAFMTILAQTKFHYLINRYTTATLGLFAKTAACINPLVYALSSPAFQRRIYSCLQMFYKSRKKNNINNNTLFSSKLDLNQKI